MQEDQFADTNKTMEELELIRRGQAVVSTHRDLVLRAGQWIDKEYSDTEVKARRKTVNDAVNACPPRTVSGLRPSAFRISGNLTASDTRIWRLSAVLIDVRAFVESEFNPWMSARDPDRKLHAAIGLVVSLLTQDANANEYLEGFTQLANMKWVDESDMAPNRMIVDTWSNRKDRFRILRIALANLEGTDSESSTTKEPGQSTLADQPKQAPWVEEDRVRVYKPDGWTRAQLINQATHDGAKCGATKFDTIRKAAEIPAAKRGGEGAHRCFSVSQVRKLITTVEAGSYRYKQEIASAWRQLLPESSSSESRMNPDS